MNVGSSSHEIDWVNIFKNTNHVLLLGFQKLKDMSPTISCKYTGNG